MGKIEKQNKFRSKTGDKTPKGVGRNKVAMNALRRCLDRSQDREFNDELRRIR